MDTQNWVDNKWKGYMITGIQIWCKEVGLGLGLEQVKPDSAHMLELEGISVRVPE